MGKVALGAIRDAAQLLPPKLDSAKARVMLAAIGLQESRFEHRRQLVGSPPRPVGPAKSYWQGEQGGGMVQGVRVHKATRDMAAEVYRARGVQADNLAIWNAIEYDDVLAAALARLLLYSDPYALPEVGDAEGAWKLYLRTWRPGKPHRGTWDALYAQAVREVVG